MPTRLWRALVLLLWAATPGAAQTDVIAPGDNLSAQNIPPIPAALAQTVGRYTEFRAAALNDWHPTRRELLIRTRFGDTSQVHHVAMPGGDRTQLTFFPDAVDDATYEPKRGRYFVFSKDTGGNEFAQNFRYDFGTGDVTRLTDGGRSQNSLGEWSKAGDRLAYTSTRRNGRDRDVYLVNPLDPQSDKLLLRVEGGGWDVLDWSPDDRRLLVGEYASVSESYLHVLDVATGVLTPLIARDPARTETVAYGGGQWSEDSQGVFVTTDRDGEFQRLAFVDLAGKKHRFLTSDVSWDVSAFDLSPDGKTVAFVTNENGASVLRLLDTRTGKQKSAPKLPLGVIGGLDWHANSRDLGFVLSSARATADVYSLDVATNAVTRWTQSETGGLQTATFSEPRLIRWNSFDSKSISGFLYRPPARFGGKRPVIINIHGGPEGQYRPGFLGRGNYLLNELGVALIFPNIRGSTGYGKTFTKLDNGLRREDSYKDIAALLDWVQTQPDLDADRVMVTGGSYGGHMTLAVATYYPERIACALDVVGISNLVTFLQNTESYRRDLRRAEYGDERDPAMRAFMEKTAPLSNAAKITKPLFVVQGANDPRVPLSEAEQMVTTVRKNGTPVWYLVAKDEGHGFSKKKNADFQFYATVLFVQTFLLK